LRVELISHTLDPERTVATAIRLCYSASDIGSLQERIDANESKRLIRMALRLGHYSVLEHASYTFAIEGISRACSHQLVRHRMASFSQQSQRYVKMTGCESTIPPSVQRDGQASECFHKALEAMHSAYNELIASGCPAEDARYILPNASDTKLIVTANARSLLNFFELRLCTRAQWEIRHLAEEMLRQVRIVSPVLFEFAGPTCDVKGYCREAEKGCGRAEPLQIPDIYEQK